MQLLPDLAVGGGGQIGVDKPVNVAVSPQSGALRGPRIKPCRSEMNSARPRFCRRQNACAPHSGDVMDGWRLLLLDFSIGGGGQVGVDKPINVAVSPQSGTLRGPRIKSCRSEMNSARPRFCLGQNACAPRSGDVMDGWRLLLLDFSVSGGRQIGVDKPVNVAVSPQSGALRGPRIKPCRSEMNSARPRFCRRQNACTPQSGESWTAGVPYFLISPLAAAVR